MNTIDLHVRRGQVLLSCERCGVELDLDPDAPLIPQLVNIRDTHECGLLLRLPVQDRRHLRLVPAGDDLVTDPR
jgi:hypothetical protein